MWYFDWNSILPAVGLLLLILAGCFYLYLLFPLYIVDHYEHLAGPKPKLLLGTLGDEAKNGSLRFDLESSQKYGPVFLSWKGRRPEINVSDLDIVKHIMSTDFDNFANKKTDVIIQKVHAEGLTLLKGDRWKYTRTTLTPTFSSGKLRQMVPFFHERMDRLAEQFEKAETTGRPLDMSKTYGGLSMDVILGSAFGVDVNSQEDPDNPFLTNAEQVFSNLGKGRWDLRLYVLVPFLRPILRVLGYAVVMFDPSGFFHRSLQSIIHQRRTEPSINRVDLLHLMLKTQTDDSHVGKCEEGPKVDKNFLTQMAQSRKVKGLTDSEVIAQALTFVLAGHETTATSLTYISHALASHPEIQEKLAEEIQSKLEGEAPNYDNVQRLQYLDMCVNEGLRMYPPIPRIVRMCQEDRVIKGVRFRKDCSVNVLVYAIHYNPDFWPEPEKFDPERFSPENRPKIRPYSFLPFSYGPRNCIGMRFALLEVKMALATVLKEYRMELCSDEPLRPRGSGVIIGRVPVSLKISKR